jgi:hypothetical protein
LAKEQDIYSLVDNEVRLTNDSKVKARDYLEKFFEILRDEKKFEREIIVNCQK